MTFEEFKAALEHAENGSALMAFFTEAVNAEKTRGISEKSSANKEAQGLRKYKQAFEKLGYDGETDLEEFVETTIKAIEGQGFKGSTELTDLQKQLKTLQKSYEKTAQELTTEKEQREVLQKQNKIKTIESKLNPKLSEEFYGSNFILKALLSDGAVDLDDSGEVIFKRGDQQLSLQDGFKWLTETNADARRNKQQSGAGSQAAHGGNQTVKYTPDQLKAMTPQQIANDIVNVNASVKAHAVAK